ncbi:hypothetical protein WBJ53_20200 [Spirosoma sp. SC4-14]|uniref:hypothetical protein n=1 Tax=Spirosoma sp. SC4-14 TaxID=3128900 RepID=UPI0030CFDD6C
MNLQPQLSEKLNWLQNSFYFIRKHYIVVLGAGLVAGFGRVVQLGGFGPISSTTHLLLEIIIESARIMLVLYVLGLASVRNGLIRIGRFFTQKTNRKAQWDIAVQNLKKQWLSIILNLIGFAVIAWTLNYLIDLLAYETCLYLTLKKDGILAQSASEWTLLLFFKNLSVIPFTLVFETLFILWITNKLQRKAISLS